MRLLMQRNTRARRIPDMLKAWRSCGVPVSALNDEQCEQLVAWLRANWRQPNERVADPEQHLQTFISGFDAAVVLDFWSWDEAVALIAPANGLLRTSARMREIYPDGFLVADRLASKALLVDYNEDVAGAKVSRIGVEAA